MPTADIAPPPLQEGETYDQFNLMISGKPYIAVDPYLMRIREYSQTILDKFNKITGDTDKRMEIFDGIAAMPGKGKDRKVYIMTPFMW